MITNLFTNGVLRVWEEDRESQLAYMEVWHEEVRNMFNQKSLIEAKAFFVPNSRYLVEYFGSDILNPIYGCYDWDGNCIWEQFIMFPVWDLKEDVVGFGGYDILSKAQQMSGEEIFVETFYRYQSKYVFERGKYLYMIPGVFQKAIKDGYICLVDGFYDKFSLHNEGFNAASNLGSTLTEETIFILSFIEHIFVLEDNDNAGRMLYKNLSRLRPNVHYIRQNQSKDADDILKSDFKKKYMDALREAIANRESLHIRLATPR